MNDLSEHLKHDRFAEYIGIERFFSEDGYWTARLKVTENHLNGLGAAQGGAIFTLADYVFAMASNTDKRTSVGLQTSISFIAPAPLGSVLSASVREISRRRTVSIYLIEIRNETDNTLIALFTGTAFTFRSD